MGTHTMAAPTGEVRRVLDAIRQIVRVLRLSAREAEKRLGLSAAQLFVLHKLGDGQAVSVNELAERTHTHQSSVSVVVHRLADKGLVRRERSSTDARRARVTITTAGLRTLRVAPEAAQDWLIESLGKMPARDRGQLARRLEQFVRETGVAEATPGLFFEDEGRHAEPTPPATTNRSRNHRGRAAE